MSDELTGILGQLRAIRSADMITPEVSAQLDVLEKRFKREYPFLFFVPRPDQQKFLDAPNRKKILFSGNRNGKTTLAAWQVVALMNGVYQNESFPQPKRWGWPLEGILLSESIKAQDRAVMPALKRLMSPKIFANFHTQKRVFRYPDGGKLWLDTYGQDRQSVAGTSPHFVQFDECPPEDIFKEVTRGLVDYGGWFSIGYTPVAGLNWLFQYKNNAKINKAYFQSGSIWDNCVENGGVLEREYIDDYLADLAPSERRAREWGKWVAITNTPVFDIMQVDHVRAKEMRQPVAKLAYDPHVSVGRKVAANEEGALHIFEWPVLDRKPLQRRWLYIIGVDASGGLTGGDPSVIQIGRRDTLTMAAEAETSLEPHALVDWVHKLARFYHQAWVVIETGVGKHGSIVADRLLDKYKYPYIFTENEGKNIGFAMTANSKPALIGECKEDLSMGAGYWHFYSDRLLEQYRLFSYLNEDKTKTGAAKGTHDDLLVAWMLIIHAHKLLPAPPPLRVSQAAQAMTLKAPTPEAQRAWRANEYFKEQLTAKKKEPKPQLMTF